MLLKAAISEKRWQILYMDYPTAVKVNYVRMQDPKHIDSSIFKYLST